jgi:hypothetical protein
VGVLPRLLQRVDHGFGHAVGQDGPALFVGLPDGGQFSVFDFEHQQTPARVHHDKVGVGVGGANRHVVSQQVVVV